MTHTQHRIVSVFLNKQRPPGTVNGCTGTVPLNQFSCRDTVPVRNLRYASCDGMAPDRLFSCRKAFLLALNRDLQEHG